MTISNNQPQSNTMGDTTTTEKSLLMAFNDALLTLSSVDASRTFWQQEYLTTCLKLSRIPLENMETEEYRLALDAKCEARAQTVNLGKARSRAEAELQSMYLKAVRGADTSK